MGKLNGANGMYYFVNEYIMQKNSSVEHAAMKRVKLFNHFKQAAKIVTKVYDRQLHRTMQTFDLQDHDVVNMFDFFQEATALSDPRVLHTDDLNLPVESEVVVGANFSQIFDGDVHTSNVGFMPGTVGQVFYQEFMDRQDNMIERDLWDCRGFKSATQYFGQNGKLMMTRYYTPAGRIVMDEYAVPDTQGNPLTSRIILKDYQQKGDLFFQNTTDLFVFFLKELARQDAETTTFIGDRPGTAVQPLLALNDAARKFLYIPINHTNNPSDPLHNPLDGFLAPAFEHFKQFDGFIVSTPQQAAQLTTRFPAAKIVAIPPVTTTPGQTMAEAPANERLLYVGRIAPDKRIDQLLRMFAIVKNRVPAATFDLYGYGAADYLKQMQALVHELDLEKSVTFKDYDPHLADHYADYQVMVNASLADGAPLAMMEALGVGIPVVSFEFNYGPKDLVLDGQTGYLVQPGDTLQMAERVVALFTDDQLCRQLGQGAIKLAETTWTTRKVWNRWQRALG